MKLVVVLLVLYVERGIMFATLLFSRLDWPHITVTGVFAYLARDQSYGFSTDRFFLFTFSFNFFYLTFSTL